MRQERLRDFCGKLTPLQFAGEVSVALPPIAASNFVDAGDAERITLGFHLCKQTQWDGSISLNVDIAQQPPSALSQRTEFDKAIFPKFGQSHLSRRYIGQPVSEAISVFSTSFQQFPH